MVLGQCTTAELIKWSYPRKPPRSDVLEFFSWSKPDPDAPAWKPDPVTADSLFASGPRAHEPVSEPEPKVSTPAITSTQRIEPVEPEPQQSEPEIRFHPRARRHWMSG
jgi:hypothetical protein